MRVLEYALTEKEFIDFQVHHFRHSPSYRVQILRTRILLGAFYALAAAVFLIFSREWPWIVGAVLVAAAGAFQVLALRKSTERRVVRSARKLLQEGGDNGTLLGPQTLELTDAELIEKNARAANAIKREAVLRIDRSETCLYVYYSAIQAFIVPLTAFRDEAEMAGFTAAIAPGAPSA